MRKFLFVLLIPLHALGQSFPTLIHQESTSSNATFGVRTTSEKKTIISGLVYDSLTLGSNSLNYTGGFVASYDSLGQNEWLIPAGNLTTNSSYQLPTIEVDDNNDIYILGEYNDTCTVGNIVIIDPGPLKTFIAKINSSGTVVWLKKITDGTAILRDICLDTDKNIILTGLLFNQLIIGTDTLVPLHQDVLIMKLDSVGDFLWMKKAGGPSNWSESGFSVDTDSFGNIIVAGHTRSIDPMFDSIVIPNQILTGFRGFVAKYDPSGNVIFAKRCGNASNTVSFDINGNSFVGGHFNSAGFFAYGDTSACCGSGLNIAYVIKISPNGSLKWAQLFNAEYSNVNAIDTDEFGNCYAVGVTRDTTQLFSNSDTLSLINNIYQQPNNCGFVIAFDSIGNPIWGNLINNSNFVIEATDVNYKDCILSVSGYFNSTTLPIFYNNDSLKSAGSTDGFVFNENICNHSTSIPDNSLFIPEIKYYPNPFKDHIHIKCKDLSELEIILYDINSIRILSKQFSQQTILNTEGLKKGAYIIEIRKDQWTIFTGKVFKF